MPVSYSIDPRRRLVVNVASGVLTAEDMRNLQSRVAADPAFQPTFSQLFDMTAVTEVAITASQLQALAEATLFAPATRRATVLRKTVLVGMARMFQAHIRDRGDFFQVFDTRAEAEKWLDAPSGAVTLENGTSANDHSTTDS